MNVGNRMRLTLLAVAPLWAMTTFASAQATDDGGRKCQALMQADFSTAHDAPFTTTNAEIVSNGTDQPYCKVEGYVVPEISFEMRLPISGWNHGFVLVGSGGWATEKFLFLCKEPLRRGYACIAGDAGHQNGQGLWMQSNPQAKIDWGYRATHVTTLAGKALVHAFYGEPPKLSLMMGCSTGGYQGLVEAQRFPSDFGGIVSVAPDINEADLAMRTVWAARSLVGEDGHPIFTADSLAVLHEAALKACDLSDGVRDGIIGDPLVCRFDPRTIICKAGERVACLTPQQAIAASHIYDGPMTSGGERLTAGGPLRGSELGWSEILDDKFPDQFFRFALTDCAGDGISATKFDFDRDYQRLGLAGTFISSNPDLRGFRQAGGKLLIVQGGNDSTEQAPVLVDYYGMVERVVGGRQTVRDFARLFIVPGMNHCTGGDGAFAIDYFAAMERWVVDGRAPEMLVGAHVPEWATRYRGLIAGLTAPVAGERVMFTRPVYPYPLHAEYNGRGDVNDFTSFHAVESK